MATSNPEIRDSALQEIFRENGPVSDSEKLEIREEFRRINEEMERMYEEGFVYVKSPVSLWTYISRMFS